MTETRPVAVLGLGSMGTALATALIATGHHTIVWNRSATRPEPRGAVRALSADEAIKASGIVIICLLDHDSVREVLSTAGSLTGRLVVNLTSGTPDEARDLAAMVEDRGAEYLDGGIMAVPPMIATPHAFILYSGSRQAFDQARPALDALGESHYFGTDPGKASLYDLALLSGMYGMFAGVLHAYALVGAADAKELAPLLTRWLTSMTGFADAAATQIDQRDYTIGVVSNLAMQAVGYPHLLEVAEQQGISPELIAPLAPLMAKRVADGYGHEDVTSVIELLKAHPSPS